ncbi:hypothetical protein [Flavobacterium aquicola]|uniref:Outer membrane protein with beta-barrel domain n=1 Tax=Flavobacterium aquicola TaxID=1682742 RepID=A0A3E0EAS3_9FLAO|nr:hypothetical protein [Flavobacterium aquicola]REG94116.1 hypothetical protein C8P67_11388 [Flavobacterium aquicola]
MKNKEAKSIFSSLENFSSPPPPELWANIEAELDKPKKKKRPVIWWWTAACLVAGFSLLTMKYGNNHELIIENNTDKVVLQNDSEQNKKNNTNKNESTIGKASLEEKANSVNEAENKNLNTNKSIISLTNNNLAATKTILPKTNNSKEINHSKGEKNNQLITEGSDKLQSDVIVVNNSVNFGFSNAVSVVEVNNYSSKSNSNGNTKTIASSENNAISESKQNKEIEKNTNSKSVQANQNLEVSGFNPNTAIAENNSTKDSLSIIKKEVAQLENALADLDKDKTKKSKPEAVIDKWSLQVFAGVMSSDNFNNEKALGSTVASKQSNGYGIKTNYKLNKKWAVSSGFKINELGQKIEGVGYYERGSLVSFASGTSPLVQDSPSKSSSVVFVSDNENYLFSSNSKASTGFETGNVTQNLKYFEMPLEVSYALLSKKKTNISMNTGGFVGKLISNDVLLNGNSIGENNNVNEFVYGTSLSSTLQYEFYKKTRFFIEPGMNYYINPLENQSFNQFQWMFNVGLNVSF